MEKYMGERRMMWQGRMDFSHLPKFQGERIMVVDDDGMQLEVMQMILQDFGCVAEGYGDAESAIAKYREYPPYTYRLILLDLRLPPWDGITVAKQIRASEKEDSITIPILAMSAEPKYVREEQVRAAGMDGYIEKPMHFPALLQQLHNVMYPCTEVMGKRYTS